MGARRAAYAQLDCRQVRQQDRCLQQAMVRCLDEHLQTWHSTQRFGLTLLPRCATFASASGSLQSPNSSQKRKRVRTPAVTVSAVGVHHVTCCSMSRNMLHVSSDGWLALQKISRRLAWSSEWESRRSGANDFTSFAADCMRQGVKPCTATTVPKVSPNACLSA